jgi:hypothetical protein
MRGLALSFSLLKVNPRQKNAFSWPTSAQAKWQVGRYRARVRGAFSAFYSLVDCSIFLTSSARRSESGGGSSYCFLSSRPSDARTSRVRAAFSRNKSALFPPMGSVPSCIFLNVRLFKIEHYYSQIVPQKTVELPGAPY